MINEYMPWPHNACGVTSEFVELMNFGPGPVNIGCYVLTTGVYSITIPANTVLQPGQFYLIAGQDFLPNDCANVDSIPKGVHANLNWNTCNCTNTTIPQTGEGMMKDDGNTPLILLDASQKVIDAVVRSAPSGTFAPITTSSVNGSCTSQTLDLSTKTINYELLGMAPGIQNSFARTKDGDCVWLKQPSVSGNASNNKWGKASDISYELDMVNPTSCDETGKGSVSIYVKHSDYASIFPMSYTISLDVNKDGKFDFNDQYETHYDYSPPFIEVDELPVGRFKLTVASSKGCYLENFDFTIIPCNPGTLPVKLVYFKNAGSKDQQHQLEWLLQDVQSMQSMVLQKSAEGEKFVTESVLVNDQTRGSKLYSLPVAATAAYRFYRLKITEKSGRSFYSPVINLSSGTPVGVNRVWPNPATDKLNIELATTGAQRMDYSIYNTSGLAVARGVLQLASGENTGVIPLSSSLPPGIYQLQMKSTEGGRQPFSFRFVKH